MLILDKVRKGELSAMNVQSSTGLLEYALNSPSWACEVEEYMKHPEDFPGDYDQDVPLSWQNARMDSPSASAQPSSTVAGMT